ncbi:Protein indeterminate-domain 1 [Forsythia ovata]|uniref:Protein indeterminate-domain 1 n=1 Tax=Forsythia ovata TaxID=205694 RepID=A0ABD1NXW5_9LAMI
MVEIHSSSPSAEAIVSTSEDQIPADEPVTTVPIKKRRNLPGMPDPDAEVIALSPRTLLATNRFVCEICNKGFQRDQNLQLHRRGHNLPWKLRQRTSKEVRKRVYVCPEPTCVHHDPSRALGDLTGIKKHFCRKHGEKKYKCERCSKKYAVQSDWKAHMKTCGTREYRCDCGTLFSRRDSFITHRAFCDALAQESARSQPMVITNSEGDLKVEVVEAAAELPESSPPPPPPLTPSTGVLSPVLSIQSPAELPENQTADLQTQPGSAALSTSVTTPTTNVAATTAVASCSSSSTGNASTSSGVFTGIFAASASAELSQSSRPPSSYSDLLCAMAGSGRTGNPIDPMSLSLSPSLYLSYGASSLFPPTSHDHQRHYASNSQPALSATALLQKAAQMGATSSKSSFLQGLGLAMSSSYDPLDNASTMASSTPAPPSLWNNQVKLENNSLASGLGLGLPSSSTSGLNDLMLGQSTLFDNNPTTLDFLGLGMGGGEAAPGGYSAFLTSIGSGLDLSTTSFGGVNSARETWDDPCERKPSLL